MRNEAEANDNGCRVLDLMDSCRLALSTSFFDTPQVHAGHGDTPR